MRWPVRAFAVFLFATMPATSCNKRDDSQLAPAASALAESKAESLATVWHYVIDPKSAAHVDMPGLAEHITGDTTNAAGVLDVAPKDLGQSRGLVRIDLSTFATHTFGNDKDETQTKHARTWLEVTVGSTMNEDMRWAEFAIRSIDNLSQADVTKVQPTKDGDDDVRTVTMTVHGDLRIHGHLVPKDAVVDATFRYPAGAPSDSRPIGVRIRSKEPMHVILKELDVRPRDPAGQILDWTTKLISKVAETADVSVDLSATPAPAAATKN